jgi:hypothetical protein
MIEVLRGEALQSIVRASMICQSWVVGPLLYNSYHCLFRWEGRSLSLFASS